MPEEGHHAAGPEPDIAGKGGGPFAGGARRRRGTAALICGLIGLVAIAAAAIGASGTRDVTDQLSYIATGGILGLFFVGAAATILILDFMIEQEAAARELASEMRQVRAFLRGDEISLVDPLSTIWRPQEAVAGPPRSEEIVAVAGARRFHRSDCSLVRGKRAAEPLPRDAALESELQPCRVCEPDLLASGGASLR